MSDSAFASTSSKPPSYNDCLRRNHPIVEAEGPLAGPWFCKVCHVRTDDAFATWSRDVLAKAKARAETPA